MHRKAEERPIPLLYRPRRQRREAPTGRRAAEHASFRALLSATFGGGQRVLRSGFAQAVTPTRGSPTHSLQGGRRERRLVHVEKGRSRPPSRPSLRYSHSGGGPLAE